MNMKMLCVAAGLALVVAGCNEEKAQTVPAKVEAAPQQVTAPQAQPAAPQAQPAEETVTPNGVVNIDWAAAMAMNSDSVLFVDVRNPPELNDGYVLGSVNIPLGELNHRLGELPKDKKLMVYCRSGRRSLMAASMLRRNGFTEVYNVNGGFLAYPKK